MRSLVPRGPRARGNGKNWVTGASLEGTPQFRIELHLPHIGIYARWEDVRGGARLPAGRRVARHAGNPRAACQGARSAGRGRAESDNAARATSGKRVQPLPRGTRNWGRGLEIRGGNGTESETLARASGKLEWRAPGVMQLSFASRSLRREVLGSVPSTPSAGVRHSLRNWQAGWVGFARARSIVREGESRNRNTADSAGIPLEELRADETRNARSLGQNSGSNRLGAS